MARMPFVVLIALFVTAVVYAQPSQQTVVFVCEHGVAKSVVAAAHFNRLAKERGLPFRAVSRGTAPDPSVPRAIREGLAGDAAPVEPTFVPARVTARDTAGAARVVTFDVTLPADVGAASVTSWTGVRNFSDGYGPARDDVVSRVEGLLRELAAAHRRP